MRLACRQGLLARVALTCQQTTEGSLFLQAFVLNIVVGIPTSPSWREEEREKERGRKEEDTSKSVRERKQSQVIFPLFGTQPTTHKHTAQASSCLPRNTKRLAAPCCQQETPLTFLSSSDCAPFFTQHHHHCSSSCQNTTTRTVDMQAHPISAHVCACLPPAK